MGRKIRRIKIMIGKSKQAWLAAGFPWCTSSQLRGLCKERLEAKGGGTCLDLGG